MAVFDVGLYNLYVREAIDRGTENPTGIDDRWADYHFIEVKADSEAQAIEKARHRYTQEKGWVIYEVILRVDED